MEVLEDAAVGVDSLDVEHHVVAVVSAVHHVEVVGSVVLLVVAASLGVAAVASGVAVCALILF